MTFEQYQVSVRLIILRGTASPTSNVDYVNQYVLFISRCTILFRVLVSAELTDEASLFNRVSGFSLGYRVLPKNACPIYLAPDMEIFHS
jgi:hypothetical protein